MANPPKNKHEFLEELESLQHLLIAPTTEPQRQEFPPTRAAQSLIKKAKIQQESPQTSLFDNPDMKASESESTINAVNEIISQFAHATDDQQANEIRDTNPFLPEHLRLREPRKHLNGLANTLTAPLTPNDSDNSPQWVAQDTNYTYLLKQLIDEVIAQHLPEIERNLRAKLAELSHEQLKDLLMSKQAV